MKKILYFLFMIISMSAWALPLEDITLTTDLVVPEVSVDYTSIGLSTNQIGALARTSDVLTADEAIEYGVTYPTTLEFMYFTPDGYVVVITGGAVLDTTTYALPDMLVSEPTSTYPAAFVDFDFVTSTNAVAANTPEINEYTRRNDGGDTLAMTAEGLDDDMAMFIVTGGTNAYVCDAPMIDGQQATVTLADEMGSNTLSLLWAWNTNGFSEPVAVNQAELWWIEKWVQSNETFNVFGANLRLEEGDPAYLYIEELDVWLESTVGDAYRAEFTAPVGATEDTTYTCYAHNGHGEKYGWSESRDLVLAKTYGFADSGATFYDVTDHGLVGDGATDNSAALSTLWFACRDDPWPTIYLPEGDFVLAPTSHLYLQGGTGNGIRFLGESRANSKIIFAATATGGQTEGMRLEKDNAVFQNLTLGYDTIPESSTYTRGLALRGDNARLVDVTIDSRGITMYEDTGRSFIEAPASSDGISFTNCAGYFGGMFCEDGSNLIVEDSTFSGMWDATAHWTGSYENFASINCTYQQLGGGTNQADGTEWNRGRMIVSGQTSAGVNWYVGDNTSIDARPRVPTPAYFGVPTSRDAVVSDGDYYTQRIHFADLSGLTIEDDYVSAMVVEYAEGEWSPYWVYTVPEGTFNRTNNYVDLRYYKYYYDNDTQYDFSFQNDPTLAWTNGLQSYNDFNAGEHIMKEGCYTDYRGHVVSSTSNTVTFADLSSYYTTLEKGLVCTIVSGRGLGQSRFIPSLSGETITIDKPWRVQPDTTSVITLGLYAANWAIHDNDYDTGKIPVSEFENNTCFAQICFGGGAHNINVEGNQVARPNRGITYEPSDSGTGNYGSVSGTNGVCPSFFWRIEDNTFNECWFVWNDNSISVPGGNSNPVHAEDFIGLGNVYRGNTSSNTIDRVYRTEPEYSNSDVSKNKQGFWIFENNNDSSFDTFSSIEAGTLRQGDLWLNNTFTADGGDGLLWIEEPLLHGNTWSGFDTNYPTAFSRVDVPRHVVPSNTTYSAVWVFDTSASTPEATTNVVGLVTGANEVVINGETNTITVLGGTETPYFAAFNGTDDYIDTGIIPTGGVTKIEVDFAFRDISGTKLMLGAANNTETYRFGTRDGDYFTYSTGVTYGSADTNRHVAVINTDLELIIDDVLVGSNVVAAVTAVRSLALGCQHGDSGAFNTFQPVDIYEYSRWDNGVLVQNIIPASTNGMYETVSGTYLLNNGTGDLTRQEAP